MPALPSLGLALLGPCNLPGHLAAIRNTPELEVVGCWGELPAGAGCPLYADPSALLHHPQVKGVVVCTQLHEREYWTREVIKAGKQVLCSSLPAATYRRLKQLAEDGRSAGVQVCLIPRLVVPPDWLAGRSDGIFYFSLKATIPQGLLRGTREGVLSHWGADCLQLLADHYGALDSVYARSRSLGLNRPEEDVVAAQLRFRNGIEGLVALNGLGSQSGVELEEWGEDKYRIYRMNWHVSGDEHLEEYYREFKCLLTETSTPVSVVRVGLRLEGLRWAEWFQQSARLDREIHASEVVHG